MEQKNLTTSQHLQTPETTKVVPSLGACCVIDDNPENKDGGFDVTSEEKSEDSIGQEINSRSDSDITKDRKVYGISNNKAEDDIKGGHSEALQNNFKDSLVEGLDMMSKKKLEDRIDGRCSVTLDGTSGDRRKKKMTSNPRADFKPGGKIHYASPTYSIDNQSGYEGDVDTIKDGESSGNVTDSDSETKKNLADNAKSVIKKAIARLDSITEEVAEAAAEIAAHERSDEEDSDFLGSSCTDTMVSSNYCSTDLEEDTTIPREILYRLLGREDKGYVRKRSKSAKRKLSTEDG